MVNLRVEATGGCYRFRGSVVLSREQVIRLIAQQRTGPREAHRSC